MIEQDLKTSDTSKLNFYFKMTAILQFCYFELIIYLFLILTENKVEMKLFLKIFIIKYLPSYELKRFINY